jgi:hypothetical protein
VGQPQPQQHPQGLLQEPGRRLPGRPETPHGRRHDGRPAGRGAGAVAAATAHRPGAGALHQASGEHARGGQEAHDSYLLIYYYRTLLQGGIAFNLLLECPLYMQNKNIRGVLPNKPNCLNRKVPGSQHIA